jgi:hypothetical protein
MSPLTKELAEQSLQLVEDGTLTPSQLWMLLAETEIEAPWMAGSLTYLEELALGDAL